MYKDEQENWNCRPTKKKKMKVHTTKAIICFTVFMWCLFLFINFCPNTRTPVTTHSSTVTKITCDRSNRMYDLCRIKGSTVVDPSTKTFYTVVNAQQKPNNFKLEKIKPYPRKPEFYPMRFLVKELTLSSGSPSPACQVHHSSPALVFSVGGYMALQTGGLTGNFYHDMCDGFVPLFVTVNSLYEDQEDKKDLILVISDVQDWWVKKYRDLFQAFSKHPVINLDKDNTTHCFPSATVGLISQGELAINSSLIPTSKTLNHFSTFLKTVYAQPRQPSTRLQNLMRPRPRLLLLSRSGNVGRAILNQDEVKQLAYDIGFDVITFEPTTATSLHDIYELIRSSHAMLGVHGAQLTHFLFLQPGAVLMQVVPLEYDEIAELCFGRPAKAMGLKYIKYKIEVGESSLLDKYGKDSLYIQDPDALKQIDWKAYYFAFAKEQKIILDLFRFRKYLEMAYYKAKKFMDSEI